MSVKRALTLKNVAKGTGMVVLGVLAIDLIATVATLAIGARWLGR
jgi:hypothetical protein